MKSDDGYMTVELLSSVLSEFEWPAAYSIEDDLPDGLILSFPRSNFVFTEGPDGDVAVRFLSENTGGKIGLQIGHALMVFAPSSGPPKTSLTPSLIENEWPFPSEEKTRTGIRNACKIILSHLLPVIHGDFSWVVEYAKRANRVE